MLTYDEMKTLFIERMAWWLSQQH